MSAIERTIAATPTRVWRHLPDLERWAEMLPSIDGSVGLGAGAIAVGPAAVRRLLAVHSGVMAPSARPG